DFRAEFGFEWTLADDRDRSRPSVGRCDQHVDALVVNEPADEQQQRSGKALPDALDARALIRIAPPVAIDRNAERNDGDAARALDERGVADERGAGDDDAVGSPVQRALNAAVGRRSPPGTQEIAWVPDDQPRRGLSHP